MIKTKLSQIADIVCGQSPQSEYYTDDNTATPFMQGNRTFGYKYPTIDTYTTKITKIASAGSILMSVRAPVGDMNISEQDICIGRGLAAINAKNGDNEFLYYALKNNINSLLKCGNGTTYDAVSSDVLSNMDILLPDNNHKEIGTILSNIDHKIALNNSICADLEAMAKQIYDYWFVQFDFPDENGNPYKSSGGKMVWNEELNREIPEGWEVDKLGNRITYNRGVSYTGNDLSKTGTPIISLASIDRQGKYIPDSIKYYNGDYSINKVVKPFDLVMANTDMTQERLVMGKIIFVPDLFKGDILTTHHITQVNTEDKLKSYLMMTTQTDWFHNYIKGFSSGTNVLGMDMIGFEDYNLVVPSDNLLFKFNDIVVDIYVKIFKAYSENEELTELRDFLLPLLMNGQVSVE